jgi:VanZ family protein
MGVVFWQSSRAIPEALSLAPDYVLHFVGYFVMGILAVRAFAGGLAEPPRRLWVWCGLAVSLVYALTDEWHQSFVPGRDASGTDFIADAAGVLAAWLGLCLLWRIPRNRVVLPDNIER